MVIYSVIKSKGIFMLTDLHLHTKLSDDAEQYESNTVCGYVNKAKELGLQYIAITEHFDILPDKGTGGLINADLKTCACQVESEKRKMLQEGRSCLTLLHGVELAHAHTCKEQAKEVLAAHNYDFVIGSLHVLKNEFDFWQCDYSGYSDELLNKLFCDYLGELYEIVSECDFDSLAHCTYPLRYYAKYGKAPELCKNPSMYEKEYAEIFKKVIERGKALEINTSDVKRGGVTLPTADLMKLYYNLGGRYVTVGSDSHDVKHLGSNIDMAEQTLKEIGFDGVTVFVERKPRIIPFKC